MKRDITKKMCSFVHVIFEFINDLKLTSFTTLINLSLVILMLLLLFLNKRKSFKHSKFTKRPSDADWRNVLVSTGIDSNHVSVNANAFKTSDDRYEICLLIRIVDETFCTNQLILNFNMPGQRMSGIRGNILNNDKHYRSRVSTLEISDIQHLYR